MSTSRQSRAAVSNNHPITGSTIFSLPRILASPQDVRVDTNDASPTSMTLTHRRRQHHHSRARGGPSLATLRFAPKPSPLLAAAAATDDSGGEAVVDGNPCEVRVSSGGSVELAFDLIYHGGDASRSSSDVAASRQPTAKEFLAAIAHLPFVLSYVDGDCDLAASCGRLAYATAAAVEMQTIASAHSPLHLSDPARLSHHHQHIDAESSSAVTYSSPLDMGDRSFLRAAASTGAGVGGNRGDSDEEKGCCSWRVVFTDVQLRGSPEPHSVHKLLVSQAPSRYGMIPSVEVDVIVATPPQIQVFCRTQGAVLITPNPSAVPYGNKVYHSNDDGSRGNNNNKNTKQSSSGSYHQEVAPQVSPPLSSARSSLSTWEPTFTEVYVHDTTEPLSITLAIEADDALCDVEFSVRSQQNGRSFSTFSKEYFESDLLAYISSDGDVSAAAARWSIPISVPLGIPLRRRSLSSISVLTVHPSPTQALGSGERGDSSSCAFGQPEMCSVKLMLQVDVTLTSLPGQTFRDTFPLCVRYSGASASTPDRTSASSTTAAASGPILGTRSSPLASKQRASRSLSHTLSSPMLTLHTPLSNTTCGLSSFKLNSRELDDASYLTPMIDGKPPSFSYNSIATRFASPTHRSGSEPSILSVKSAAWCAEGVILSCYTEGPKDNGLRFALLDRIHPVHLVVDGDEGSKSAAVNSLGTDTPKRLSAAQPEWSVECALSRDSVLLRRRGTPSCTLFKVHSSISRDGGGVFELRAQQAFQPRLPRNCRIRAQSLLSPVRTDSVLTLTSMGLFLTSKEEATSKLLQECGRFAPLPLHGEPGRSTLLVVAHSPAAPSSASSTTGTVMTEMSLGEFSSVEDNMVGSSAASIILGDTVTSKGSSAAAPCVYVYDVDRRCVVYEVSVGSSPRASIAGLVTLGSPSLSRVSAAAAVAWGGRRMDFLFRSREGLGWLHRSVSLTTCTGDEERLLKPVRGTTTTTAKPNLLLSSSSSSTQQTHIVMVCGLDGDGDDNNKNNNEYQYSPLNNYVAFFLTADGALYALSNDGHQWLAETQASCHTRLSLPAASTAEDGSVGNKSRSRPSAKDASVSVNSCHAAGLRIVHVGKAFASSTSPSSLSHIRMRLSRGHNSHDGGVVHLHAVHVQTKELVQETVVVL